MSKPTAGTYYIFNRILSPTGEKLAITFNGQGNAATVTPLTNADSQKWKIVDYSDGKNQSFTPLTATSLQAGIVANVITVLPARGYVYFARVGPDGLSIQGGNGSVPSWDLATAATTSPVLFADGLGGEKSFWVLQAV